MITIFDHYVRHSVQIERFTTGQSNKLIALSGQFDDRASGLMSDILQSYESGHLTQQALQIQLNDIISIYSDSSAAFSKKISEDLSKFIESEFRFQTSSLDTLLNDRLAPISAITPKQITAIALNNTIQNASLNSWVEGLSISKSEKLTTAIRFGTISGQSVTEITNNLNGILRLDKNNTRTVIRSAVQSVAATTRNSILEENADIVDGIIWLSALDNRTTAHICGPRDGKKYTFSGDPIGHDYVWLGGPGNAHWNCRSTGVPNIPESNLGRRPAVSGGKNYERGDNKNRNGRVTKPLKKNREKGIYKVERVNSSTNYEDWLIRQPKDFQDDILGVTKGKLFRNGELNLSDMSDRFGSSLTLEELDAQNLINIENIGEML